MFRPEFGGGPEQFNPPEKRSEIKGWPSDITKRIEIIKKGIFKESKETTLPESKTNIPTVETLIFEALAENKVPPKIIEKLSFPLQEIIRIMAQRLEEGK